MILKVCGMRDSENIVAVDKLGVDWMGFIFYPKSSRYVDTVPNKMPINAKRVGVFVNEEITVVKQISSKFSLDIIQLHGNESPSFCSELSIGGFTVMKAFSVDDVFPSSLVKSYQHTCKYFLFDTKTESFGGSGKKFDWGILSDYDGETPFLLSGGLSIEDANELLNINHPKLIGLDVNSKFEVSPALKDISKIEHFIKQIKQNE
ncbi:MAG: phosphoribosylanthranilate isomerase [Proteiniphilum sp.]|nr:phosphoribosylanthranilate isomerase [Proteiniphilum sp.]